MARKIFFRELYRAFLQRFHQLRIRHCRQPHRPQQLLLRAEIPIRLHQQQNGLGGFQCLRKGIKQFLCRAKLLWLHSAFTAGQKRQDFFLGGGTGGHLVGIEG